MNSLTLLVVSLLYFGYSYQQGYNRLISWNSFDEYNRLFGGKNERIISRSGVRSPHLSNSKPIKISKPFLIRKNRQTSYGNSRVYIAGRDYDNLRPEIHNYPIHRIESPRPVVSHLNNHNTRAAVNVPTLPISNAINSRYSLNSFNSNIGPEVRSVFHSSLNSSTLNSISVSRPTLSRPIAYSGRGILSPSAAARLRATSLRDGGVNPQIV